MTNCCITIHTFRSLSILSFISCIEQDRSTSKWYTIISHKYFINATIFIEEPNFDRFMPKVIWVQENNSVNEFYKQTIELLSDSRSLSFLSCYFAEISYGSSSLIIEIRW